LVLGVWGVSDGDSAGRRGGSTGVRRCFRRHAINGAGANLSHHFSAPLPEMPTIDGFLSVGPLSFGELLTALGQEELADALVQQDWGLLAPFNSRLVDWLG